MLMKRWKSDREGSNTLKMAIKVNLLVILYFTKLDWPGSFTCWLVSIKKVLQALQTWLVELY